jgi:ribosome-associated toxin RatA of RatAB toxin-antitoxin module
MAEHASGEIIIDSTLLKILEILLELDDYSKWIPDVKEVDVQSRDNLGRALIATLHTSAMGQNIVQTYKYSYENYPYEISWTFLEGNMVSSLDGKYVLTIVDENTSKLLYDLEIELTSPLPGFIKRKAAQKIVDSALKNLKVYAEK